MKINESFNLVATTIVAYAPTLYMVLTSKKTNSYVNKWNNMSQKSVLPCSTWCILNVCLIDNYQREYRGHVIPTDCVVFAYLIPNIISSFSLRNTAQERKYLPKLTLNVFCGDLIVCIQFLGVLAGGADHASIK